MEACSRAVQLVSHKLLQKSSRASKSQAPLDDFLSNDTQASTKRKKFSLSTFDLSAQIQKRKVKQKEEKDMKSMQETNVTLGDIYYSSWGV